MRINVLWAVVALLAGLVLGAWGPRMDLCKARDEIKALQSKSDKRTKRASELQSVRDVLRLPDQQPQGRRGHPPSRVHADVAVAETNELAAATTRPPAPPASSELPTNRLPRHVKMDEQIRQASELWQTRVDLARNSFVSNTELTKEQEAGFDVLVEAMNIRLEDRITKWADYLKTKGEIGPEDGIRMINDLSSVLVLTYDEFDRKLPPTWREKAGSDFQLFNFIDPEVALPLTEIEGLNGKTAVPAADPGVVQ